MGKGGLLGLAAIAVFSVAADDARSDKRPVVVFGANSDFPPYSWKDPDGRAHGFTVELIRAIGDAVGWSVRVELGPWPTIRDRLDAGDGIDVSDMCVSAERAEIVDFAATFGMAHDQIFVRRGEADACVPGHMKGKRVLLQASSYTEGHLEKGVIPLPAISQPMALSRLADGEGDCAMISEVTGRAALRRLGIDNVIGIGAPLNPRPHAFAVRAGRHDLGVGLEHGLAMIKANGQYEVIYDRWFGEPRDDTSLPRYLLLAGGMLAAAAGLALAWSWSLRRKVRLATGRIEAEHVERERAQAALLRSEAQLQRARRLESIGRLAGGIAHDFNNLLTIILMLGNRARHRATDPALVGDLDDVCAAGERAATLTRQLLAFSRRQVLAPRELDVNDIVRELQNLLGRLLGDDIQLEVSLSKKPCAVVADPAQLEQVIVNLVVNARDAMPHGGRLEVRTFLTDLPADESRELAAGGYVGVEVTDQGDGISEEVRPHIFEPFFTTKEPGQGTGLGLATVYGIVRQSGGFIDVESAESGGARFTVYLPHREGDGPSVVRQPAPRPSLDGRERILVVEDERILRRVVSEGLRARGYEVIAAGHGEEALAVVNGESVALLITDVAMPGMRGDELARKLRARDPALRVIFVSGYAPAGSVAATELGQGVTFVAKPFTIDDLAARVRTLLDQSDAA